MSTLVSNDLDRLQLSSIKYIYLHRQTKILCQILFCYLVSTFVGCTINVYVYIYINMILSSKNITENQKKNSITQRTFGNNRRQIQKESKRYKDKKNAWRWCDKCGWCVMMKGTKYEQTFTTKKKMIDWNKKKVVVIARGLSLFRGCFSCRIIIIYTHYFVNYLSIGSLSRYLPSNA